MCRVCVRRVCVPRNELNQRNGPSPSAFCELFERLFLDCQRDSVCRRRELDDGKEKGLEEKQRGEDEKWKRSMANL